MKEIMIKKTYIFPTELEDTLIIEPGVQDDYIGIVISRHGDVRRTWISIDIFRELCKLEYEIVREAKVFSTKSEETSYD